jgi:tetratricopeptide (TPR) repeat protein
MSRPPGRPTAREGRGARPARRSRRAWLAALPVLVVILAAAAPDMARAQSVTADGAIRLQQRRIQRNPHDAGAYHRLADAYIQKARETGDMSYFDLAERALGRSMAIAPTNAGALRHLAFVFSSRHDFERAVVQARRALEIDPADGGALGVLGDALLELGRYDEAQTAYARMMEMGRDLASLSRRSGMRTLRGDPAGSMADLEQAIGAGRASGQPRESIAWAQWQLGEEHFAVGNLSAAETSYEDAAATYPGYHRALAGLARVRAAQARYPEAIDLYRRALGVIPLPEYATALGDVYARVGRAAEAAQQYALVEYVGRLTALNRTLYNRQLAYFYADHGIKPVAAIELARRELDVRKDIYGYDALAWALYRGGHADLALAPMIQALRLGTRDARLFFHAGMICHGLGRTAPAIHWLELALATNPHFHLLQADVARATLAELRSSAGAGEGDHHG